MQAITTTHLRTDLTGLLQNLDEPLAITKHGKTVAWLVGPSYNPLEASEEPTPSADTSGDTEPVTSPSEPFEAMPEEDEEESDDWDLSMEADFERYLSNMTPDYQPLD
jgi:antitoxin (DNA-binding transcriptional repressor) of toxin-antitoxin stability system